MLRGGKANRLAFALTLLAAGLTLQCRPAPKNEGKIVRVHMRSNGDIVFDGKKITRARFFELVLGTKDNRIDLRITRDEPPKVFPTKGLLEDAGPQKATHIGFSGIIDVPNSDKNPAKPQEKKVP